MPRPRRPWNANIHYHDLVLQEIAAGSARVLDVGCGDGILSAQLADVGVPHVIALDADAAVLERARARHHGNAIEWMHGDVFDAPLEPATFDAVVSVATLHHLDAERALRLFSQLVRPGGVVAVVGLAREDWWMWPYAVLGFLARSVLGLAHGCWQHSAPMCWPPQLTYSQVHALVQRLLPEARYRRHFLGRYSVIWRRAE